MVGITKNHTRIIDCCIDVKIEATSKTHNFDPFNSKQRELNDMIPKLILSFNSTVLKEKRWSQSKQPVTKPIGSYRYATEHSHLMSSPTERSAIPNRDPPSRCGVRSLLNLVPGFSSAGDRDWMAAILVRWCLVCRCLLIILDIRVWGKKGIEWDLTNNNNKNKNKNNIMEYNQHGFALAES